MNIKVEWNKIVTNAISTLVAVVFIGAATIVWNGATSVDSKVQNTREDMTHLIATLSDKLAGYEVQLSSLSNQLSVVIKNQSANINAFERLPGAPIPSVTTVPAPIIPSPTLKHSKDIMQQLKR